MANTYSTRLRQLGLKVEGTFGVDAVVAAADLISPLTDLEYEAEIDLFEREVIRGTLSPLAQIPGERSAKITFQTELKGSGTAGDEPAHLDVAFRACGFARTDVPATSNTYDLVSTGFESVTAEIRELEDDGDAIVKKVLGCAGTVEVVAEKGRPVLLNFELVGKYVEPFRVASPGALTPEPNIGLTPLPFLGVSFSFFGVGTLLLQAVTVATENEMTLKNDINDASGNIGARITARKPSGSINPEQVDPTVFNPWNEWTSANEGALSYTLGSVAGNTVTVSAPNAQIIGVTDGDRDTIRTNELELQLNGGSSGNDELQFVFA